MAKDRRERNELGDNLLEMAAEEDSPLRAMAEMMADFVMEAKVAAKCGRRVVGASRDEPLLSAPLTSSQMLLHRTIRPLMNLTRRD